MGEGGIKVLIVDDEEGITRTLKQFLMFEDFEVFTTNNPREAAKIIRENDIKVVVSDIMMPEMDGCELLEKIKKNYPLVQVVMMTGKAKHDKIDFCLKHGASDFLSKPFNDLNEVSHVILEEAQKEKRWEKALAS